MSKDVKITAVKTYPIRDTPDGSNAQPVACPMAIYPEYRPSRPLWRDDFGQLLVKIETDAGVEGIGYTSMGSVMAAVSIELHLSKLLIGQDPRRVERLNDIMQRSTFHQGRDGFLMHGISAVDLALWDIKAKLADSTVCGLLGGPVQDGLPCYMTGYDESKVRREKFFGIKTTLKYGPGSGREGLKANVADVAGMRERLGPETDIMLDCWMGLDVPYTLELAKAVEPYRVRWIEEPLLAGDVDGYRLLRQKWSTDTWIATGEHETLVRGASPFFKERLVDVWQADVTWAGGITEMQKIAAMASEAGVKLIPHYGYTPWAAHFILSSRACPAIEWYDLTGSTEGGAMFKSDMVLKDGRLYPGSKPGFGIEIDWDIVERNLDRRVNIVR